MNSRMASNLAKQMRTSEKYKPLSDGMAERVFPVMTDYQTVTSLENAPLRLRARYATTRKEAEKIWPNRPIIPKEMPTSRNGRGSIFRRYPDGTLDVGWARGQVEEGLRLLQLGVPLTENQALVVSSVYGLQFSNLPTAVVKRKAFLTNDEKAVIRRQIPEGVLSAAVAVAGD